MTSFVKEMTSFVRSPNASAMPGPVLGPGPPGADILAPLGGGEKSGRGFAQLVPRLCVSLSWVLGFPPPLEFVPGDRLLEEAAGVRGMPGVGR